MGDLAADTALRPIDEAGRFRIRLTRDWETWGPNGGYLAAVALRAAAAVTAFPRPATLSCLFLGVGDFDADVEVEADVIRRTKRADAVRVRLVQDERALVEAHAWAIADGLPGLEHDATAAPDVPPPAMVPTADNSGRHRFWHNFDSKRVDSMSSVREWVRFSPVARFDDPWVDACRSVVLLDLFQWPAALGAHARRGPEEPAFIAPNIDLSVRFHRADRSSEWLLVDARSPIAEAGLMAGQVSVWSEDGRLLASAGSHLLCREVPRGTPGSGT